MNKETPKESRCLPLTSIDLLDRRASPEREAEKLEYGKHYRTKGDSRFRDGSILKYCGKVQFNNELRFEFWSDDTRLLHWLSPDNVDAV